MSERRYRQRGYMDDEPREPRAGKPGHRPERDGPRGRGLGSPTDTVFRCARCGRRQDLGVELSPTSTCPGCGDDLRTCTHCAHFDSGAPNECREPVPARIAKKATRNECTFFAPKRTAEFASDSGEPSDPRAAFDALFDF